MSSSSSSNTGTSLTPGSDAFLDSLLSMVNQEDMIEILKAQSQMLDRFEKTNEMLSNFNRLSSKRYEKTFEQFKEHTETLLTMKKDLDSVFRRIRNLKKKLAADYPRAFVAALEDIVPPDLDGEEDEPGSGFSHSPSHQQPKQPSQHPPASPRQQELHQQQHPQPLSQPQHNHPPHPQQQQIKHQQPQKQQELPKSHPHHPPHHQHRRQAPQKQMSLPQQNHPPHSSPHQKLKQQSQKQQSLDVPSRTKEEASNSRHDTGSDK